MLHAWPGPILNIFFFYLYHSLIKMEKTFARMFFVLYCFVPYRFTGIITV